MLLGQSVEQRPAPLGDEAGVFRVDGVLLRPLERDPARASGLVGREQRVHLVGIGDAGMQQQDVRDLAAGQLLRQLARPAENADGGIEVGVAQFAERDLVVLFSAPGPRRVPGPIVEVDGDVGFRVAVCAEPRGGLRFSFWCIPLEQERIAEHFSVRLVARDVREVRVDRRLVRVGMRPGVVAERIARGTPVVEDLLQLRMALELLAVDETVRLRDVVLAQGGEDVAGDPDVIELRPRPVRRQVVHGDGDLDRCGGEEKSEDHPPGMYSRARFSNLVCSWMKARLAVPMGPLRCLPMTISATPFTSSFSFS